MITKIKVWKADKYHRFAGEVRIYVDFSDRKESGCYYKTGNSFNSKGSLEGMTEAELAEAKSLALVDNGQGGKKWSNYTAEEPKISYNKSYARQLDNEKREEEYARQTRIIRGLGDTIDGGMV